MFLKVVGTVWAAYVGFRAFKQFRTGTLRISNFSAPSTVISREERPLAFWCFVVFFYAVLIVIVAMVATSRNS